jgi:hypothetical protein
MMMDLKEAEIADFGYKSKKWLCNAILPLTLHRQENPRLPNILTRSERDDDGGFTLTHFQCGMHTLLA